MSPASSRPSTPSRPQSPAKRPVTGVAAARTYKADDAVGTRMVNFTLIELHLDDAQLTANAPGSGGGPSLDLLSGSEGEESGDAGSQESSGGSKLPLLVGLVFLVAVAAVARRKMSTGDAAPELEDVTA